MAQEVKVDPIYISASASRNNASDSRSTDGCVLFSSHHLIATSNTNDESSRGVHKTLTGHGALVSSLKFTQNDEKCFVSGDANGTFKLWSQETFESDWSEIVSSKAHTGSIAAIQALALEGDHKGKYLVMTGGSDALIKVYLVEKSSRTVEEVQTIDCKGKIPLAFAISHLPDSNSLVLAVGSTNNLIQLYSTFSTSSPCFEKSLSLQGHTDWIRCLSFTLPTSTPEDSSEAYDLKQGEILLASGSQDNYIRLWRFIKLATSSTSPSKKDSGLSALDELEKKLLGDSAQDKNEIGELRVKSLEFAVTSPDSHSEEFSCTSEAVLLGHDAWVTSLNWSSSSSDPSQLELLSSSADRSLILWTPLLTTHSSSSTAAAHLWTSQHRFGEFSSVTNLGFFGALWSRGRGGERVVMASGWGGSWHVWKEEGGGEWEPVVSSTGHADTVRQVVWERDGGEYLLSASHDMSTRLHAPWKRQKSNGKQLETWHELGRPQIHGYPLSSLSFISPTQFVSGADEKLVRVFDAPKVFVDSLKSLSGVDLGDSEGRPMAANVPPLGLSNRAITSQAEVEQISATPASNDPFEATNKIDFSFEHQHPPFEEQLLGSTLWPETEKLYGHSFELVCISTSNTLPMIATACKATLPSHALIRLYDTRTWQPIKTIVPQGGVLEGHSLTITKLAFSGNDRWLLSVSRDRSWRIYERVKAEKEGDEELGYRSSAVGSKAHARIIWDACWSTDIEEEESWFATASRDKTVKLWTRSGEEWGCAQTVKFDEAATSIATVYLQNQQLHLLSVGLENGQIHLYTSSTANSNVPAFIPLYVLEASISHVLAVTTLSFCPEKDLPEGVVARLASGSEDRSVRIFDIRL
ncbi:hypothetical protein JCM5353_000803 [Sporobolomyces roseus]